MQMLTASELPPIGFWFGPPNEETGPCCEPHRARAMRPGEEADVIQASVAVEPSARQIAEMASSLLRAAWGPRWPGWLCREEWFGGTSAWNCETVCTPQVRWWQADCEWPIVAVVSATLVGTDVASSVRVDGTRILYAPAGVPALWPAGELHIRYRYGAVPAGAELPFRRLYCQLRRLYRPIEGVDCAIPRKNAIRSVSTPGGSVGYTDKEVEQGLLGWDPVVSAFVSAGMAQRDAGTTGAGTQGMSAVWAPTSNRSRFAAEVAA